MIYKKRILRPSAIYIIILAGSMISYVQHEIFPIAIALGVTMLCYLYSHYISQNRDRIVIDQTGIVFNQQKNHVKWEEVKFMMIDIKTKWWRRNIYWSFSLIIIKKNGMRDTIEDLEYFLFFPFMIKQIIQRYSGEDYFQLTEYKASQSPYNIRLCCIVIALFILYELCGAYAKFFLILAVFYTFWYIYDRIKSHCESLNITEAGVSYVNKENQTTFIKWDNISQIELGWKYLDTALFKVLDNHQNVIFELSIGTGGSSISVNYYRLEKSILCWTKQPDILKVSSKLWYLKVV